MILIIIIIQIHPSSLNAEQILHDFMDLRWELHQQFVYDGSKGLKGAGWRSPADRKIIFFSKGLIKRRETTLTFWLINSTEIVALFKKLDDWMGDLNKDAMIHVLSSCSPFKSSAVLPRSVFQQQQLMPFLLSLSFPKSASLGKCLMNIWIAGRLVSMAVN